MSISDNRKKEIRFILMAAACALACTLLLAFAGLGLEKAQAGQLTPYFSSTDGSACSDISDGDYFTTEYFDSGTEITLSSDSPMDSLYIVWENIPGEWTLKAGDSSYTYGKEGYLHEYIKLPSPASSVTICVDQDRLTIADVYAFSEGELPGFVQTWDEPCEEADILLISTHADDEVLFFGGVIPDYVDKGDLRIQVAYFSDLFQTEPYRNHEILNGLWHMGVTHYPQLGEFYDYYSESYEEAVEQYDYDQSMEYIVRTIRRFKPQVLIGQDPENGEYGHGGHMWCARVMKDALEVTGDPESYPESADQYGTWDVPKTYFHLYPEGAIELDARTPLASFGGKTELEVAKEAYEEHQSQQWCWFYVSDGYDEEGNPDGYEYSCTKYGLFRSLVGADTGNDLMENLVSYNEQERKAAQAEKESKEAEEAAAKAAEAEKESQAQADAEGTAATAQSVLEDNNPTAVPGGKNTTAITILIIVAVIVLLIMIGIIVVSRSRARVRQEQRRLEQNRRKRAAQSRSRYTSTVNRNSSGYQSTASGNVRQVYGGRSTGGSGNGRTSHPGSRTASANRSQTSGSYRSENGGSRTSGTSRSVQNGSRTSGSRNSYTAGRQGTNRDTYR